MIDNFSMDEEIRCEFLVNMERKHIWAIELDLLTELQRVCNKYNLKCFAIGGTLLGTIRHKGFIPWDDDLDVGLSRKDYDKLCEVAGIEFKYPYFFQTALTDRNYFIGSARLRNANTTGIIKGFDQHKYNNGIFIDIYVYDEMPDKELQIKKHIKRLNRLSFLLNNYYYINASSRNGAVVAMLIMWFVRLLFSYEKLFDIYKKQCTKYSNTSGKLGLFCIPTFINYLASQKGISNLLEKPFENTSILVPADYDYMLTSAYNNYMSFPPVDKRGKWHEDIIVFDPNIPFTEYYLRHKEQYSDVIKEYNQLMND